MDLARHLDNAAVRLNDLYLSTVSSLLKTFYLAENKSWIFPAVMMASFIGVLASQRKVRIRPARLRGRRSLTYREKSNRTKRMLQNSSPDWTGKPTPRTPRNAPLSRLALGGFHTPVPGPTFGHVLANEAGRSKNGYPGKGASTKRVLKRGYPTPVSKGVDSSPDYSLLAQKAPESYATLQKLGLLDEQGTPTKKLREKMEHNGNQTIIDGWTNGEMSDEEEYEDYEYEEDEEVDEEYEADASDEEYMEYDDDENIVEVTIQ